MEVIIFVTRLTKFGFYFSPVEKEEKIVQWYQPVTKAPCGKLVGTLLAYPYPGSHTR